MQTESFQRYPGDPVFSPNDVPFESSRIFSAGSVKFWGSALFPICCGGTDTAECLAAGKTDDLPAACLKGAER